MNKKILPLKLLRKSTLEVLGSYEEGEPSLLDKEEQGYLPYSLESFDLLDFEIVSKIVPACER